METRSIALSRTNLGPASRGHSAAEGGHSIERLPRHLQVRLGPLLRPAVSVAGGLEPDRVYRGDARSLLPKIAPNSVALSFWSPPYFVGKNYEAYLSYQGWQRLLETVIDQHFPLIKPGGFLVINIADILCFKDASMPRISAAAVDRRRSVVTREDVLRAMSRNPGMNRYQIARLLGCSEQTVDRRLNGNNIRGGKYDVQTRVKIVGGLIEQWGLSAGFYPYDRRIWVKDPAWENSRWTTLSYKALDEFEYLYFLWKPGITSVRRSRITKAEWRDWGARGVWTIPSVRSNDDHEAKFPLELAARVVRLLTEPKEVVLDCFLGSGTTAVAALQTGRRFIGIELRKEYVALAKRRIASARTELRGA
ncbi:MAG: site-specific DNA-methyltransferase [Planctomycetes bacterium]|nr:site-specific DNA-methyltransferase [Planctomycetota bacterium]